MNKITMDDQVTELLASEVLNKWPQHRLKDQKQLINSEIPSFEYSISKYDEMRLNECKMTSNLLVIPSSSAHTSKLTSPTSQKYFEYKPSVLLNQNNNNNNTNTNRNIESDFHRLNESVKFEYSASPGRDEFFNNKLSFNLPNNFSLSHRSFEPIGGLDGLFNPYDTELQKKLSQLLTLEGKKREKAYFCDTADQKKLSESLFSGLIQCLEDYQLDINLYKHLNTQLKDSLENYENQFEQRKEALERDFEEKSETIRKDFEFRMDQKNYEINDLNNRLNQICLEKTHLDEIVDQKVNYRDTIISELRSSYETLEKEHAHLQKELKEAKLVVESLKNEQTQRKTSIDKLETEKKTLQIKLTSIEKEIRECETNSTRLNSLLNEYKQSAESLSKQNDALRQQFKECQKESYEAKKNLKEEKDAKEMLEMKIKSIVQEQISCEELRKSLKEVESELNQLKIDQNIRLTEVQELKTTNKHLEAKLNEVNTKNMDLIHDKEKLITNSINLSNELNQMRENLKNSTTLIDHNCKVNNILKSEKDGMVERLRESEEKLTKINSGHKKLKMTIKYMKQENDELTSKQAGLNETNRNLQAEKDECLKQLDAKTSQIQELKHLNTGLSQEVKERDQKCAKLEKSITLLEKEIGLLKQVQTLNTTEENTRMMKLVDSIQLKLEQKTKKIQELKNNVSNLKKEIATLKKIS